VETGPEGNVVTIVRRRRTRRHRRNRLTRRVVSFCALLLLASGLSAVALHYLTPSLFRASQSKEPDRQAVEASREKLVNAQQESLRSLEGRPVYRYSVVPGGVRDVGELKWAAAHDPVVAAHYAGFDYDHARVVRLVLARTAYVSYRIGNKVYWTRHRVSLKAGETVITDGKMTARTRCANRVEEVPPQLHSSLEPPVMDFEEPMMPQPGTAQANPPVPYQSSIMRPMVPGLGPAPPLSLYDPFGPGTYLPLAPPALPSGVCGPLKKKGTGTGGTGSTGNKKNPGNPCGEGGGGVGTVPEPGTWLLMVSGLVLMLWFARKRILQTGHPNSSV
jgi:PEP-CTERM motif-containing protein